MKVFNDNSVWDNYTSVELNVAWSPGMLRYIIAKVPTSKSGVIEGKVYLCSLTYTLS